MRTAVLILFPLVVASGCSSGLPRRDVREYPALHFPEDFIRIRETTRLAMRSARFPIETASDRGFTGPLVEDRGFSWRLDVALGREDGAVRIAARLEVIRDREFRPVRGALANMGAMGLEEQRGTALRSNPEAYSRDREAMERHAPSSDREARIDALGERVVRLLNDLETRLRPDSAAGSGRRRPR